MKVRAQVVRDAADNLAVATSRRHNLIFGRRGVGKTALLLEAQKVIESRDNKAFWLNVQSIRGLGANKAFLFSLSELCQLPLIAFAERKSKPESVAFAHEIEKRIMSESFNSKVQISNQVDNLLPLARRMLRAYLEEMQCSLYLFLDDVHYLPATELPIYLDRIHALSRDLEVWIKAAGIRHQSRWFTDNPPVGLQTGHDATIINLDITLEEPTTASKFLNNVFRTYLTEARIKSSPNVISGAAINRLVLASGGVPRDFLTLCGAAIQLAKQRLNARRAGVQDVNEAAGRAATIKLQELEDDAAATGGDAERKSGMIQSIKNYLLNDQQCTYFRIAFADKEANAEIYTRMQGLMDLRFLHLINSGVSDQHHAGKRFEVYMLDLSQFSGSRFKHNLRVLDFSKGHIVMKQTGKKELPTIARTSKQLLAILRKAPVLDLQTLS